MTKGGIKKEKRREERKEKRDAPYQSNSTPRDPWGFGLLH